MSRVAKHEVHEKPYDRAQKDPQTRIISQTNYYTPRIYRGNTRTRQPASQPASHNSTKIHQQTISHNKQIANYHGPIRWTFAIRRTLTGQHCIMTTSARSYEEPFDGGYKFNTIRKYSDIWVKLLRYRRKWLSRTRGDGEQPLAWLSKAVLIFGKVHDPLAHGISKRCEP